MSKICQTCGKTLDDTMRFCDGCGTPQQAAPQQSQYESSQPTQYEASQQVPAAAAPNKTGFDFHRIVERVKLFASNLVSRCKADKAFMYKCIGITAAAVVVVIVLLSLIFGGGGYTAPIDALIDVTFEGKAKKIKDLAPADYWEWYEEEYDEDIDEIIDEAEDDFDSMLDYLEEMYGDNIRVSYKVKDKKALSDRRLEGIAESLADKYDLDEDKFTAGYELELEMTIKGSEGKDEDETEVTVIKYKGKWYAVSWYKSSGDYYASFLTGF